MTWDTAELLAVRDRHAAWLMREPGVTGTAIGYDGQGRLCLKILTNRMAPEIRRRVAERLQDIPIYFEEVGEIEAQ